MTIIFGLGLDALLTLVFVPTIYSLVDDASAFARRVAIWCALQGRKRATG